MPHEQEPHSRLPILLVLLTGAMALVLAAVEVESLSPVLGNISMLLGIALVPVAVAKLVSTLSRSARTRPDDTAPDSSE